MKKSHGYAAKTSFWETWISDKIGCNKNYATYATVMYIKIT